MQIVDALKSLCIKMKGSGTKSDIKSDQIVGVIQYISDNWDSIKNTIGSGGVAATVDTLTGATETGKAVMKAENQEAARTAIGAGVPYTLPAAGAQLGGVKKAAAVNQVSAENAGTIGDAFVKEEVQKIASLADGNKTAINAIIVSLQAAGIMA